ncbi:efflux RND transporter permease subunit [Zooshikella harenae]|uniref:Efflux RND transporter permease subunit n=1 Tax=Zooshikella harenae TaxID=2827238 RepID=A0ABS5ZA72_9GAMM|nr:efflux RND transporter permease subunit [Zooshikella harenae]MBU2710944.1 efflux RND transporter permease subunit [Zooshikella harenae]
MWLRSLIENHKLTNLLFLLILLMGYLVYLQLPREQDPSINFNWVQITTLLPGASAQDIEKKITDVLEEELEKIQNVKFVSSTSREGVSSILVRFQDISQRLFDKRMADLRREINNVEDELPEEAESPTIYEVTTANAFPTATVVISGPADDENLRRQAIILENELIRTKGVDRVQLTGERDPEIQIRFDVEKIQLLGISPTAVADTIRTFYRDISAGSARVGEDQWLIRVEGTTTNPDELAQLPVLTNQGSHSEVRLGDIAEVVWARAKADRLVRFQGRPAVMFAVMKQESTNTLELVERISHLVEDKNKFSKELGVNYTLIDDQTLITRNALSIMENNALIGLAFVLFVTWFFLGSRISLLVTIGIPFTLAGTFIMLKVFDQTLNTSVLLAIVIALGMLVDDAVVVVESINNKIRSGLKGIHAAWTGLTEVIGPVTASVLTTMAAFLPLMLLPGILGKFMMVIPLVVTTALAVSLIEAYWMLPGHIIAAKVSFARVSAIDNFRQHIIHKFKVYYGYALLKVMRHPKKTISALVLLFAAALSAVESGVIRVDFFAADTIRLFYVNVEMPTNSSLDETMDKMLEVEKHVAKNLEDHEVRSVVSYAGQMFTETAPMFGEHLGQIMVSLQPRKEDYRSVEQIIEDMRSDVLQVIGPTNISFLKLAGGPPTSKPVSVKVRGKEYSELRQATDALKAYIAKNNNFRDISDDDSKGRYGLTLKLNNDAINRLDIVPNEVYRTVKMLVDGEIVSYVQHESEQVALRIKSTSAVENNYNDINELLRLSVPTRNGDNVPLKELVNVKTEQVKGNLRHYNFLRTITLESDIDKQKIDTVAANNLIKDYWETIAKKYPNVSLDFSGELDDIQESIDAIAMLFMLGIGLMYLILSTQFQSYFQPLMVLITVPMAFTGVVLGLFVSSNPLSLFTLYGIVALAGIAVNAAIVLISTANKNLAKGMTLIHAIFYASRRRMLPILITTLTTIAGLFSLAVGLGGHSLIWSPVATAIVWGLFFSTFLTLFVVPALYQMSMYRVANKRNMTLFVTQDQDLQQNGISKDKEVRK